MAAELAESLPVEDIAAEDVNPEAQFSPGVPTPGSTRQRRRTSLVKRQKLLEVVISEGVTIEEACRRIGVVYQTYSYWRKTDPEFKAAIDAIRVEKVRARGGGWQGDFASFRETYLPLEYPTPPFHLDIVDRLESAPALSISMVLCPPNHGKTTVMEDWISFKLATDPNHRITVVSKSQGQARKMLSRVQRRMTDITQYREFISRFGPFYTEGQEREGKSWTRDYFTVYRANHDERDYSFQVLGWSGQVYGSRVDTLILDDIQTRDNLTAVDSMLDKFNLEYFSRLDEKQGRIFIMGTRIEVGDIYERLIDADVISSKRLTIYPAINYEGKALWEDRWPVRKLDHDAEDPDDRGIRQKIGEKAWWCGYQQQPALSGSATFNEEMIDRACSKDHVVGPAAPGCPVVLGLDPALGGGNAIMAVAYGMDHMTILDCQRDTGLGGVEEILRIIEQYALRYNPQALVVETVAFQRGLARDDRLRDMGNRLGFRIIEHNTGRNKLDPVMGVASMDTSFIRGEITIPWGNDIAEARMKELVAELRAWRPNVPTRLITQDLVMALWFCWLYILNERRAMGSPADAWRRGAIPWTPTQVPGGSLVLSGRPSRKRTD